MPDPEQMANGVANVLKALGVFDPDPGAASQGLNSIQQQGAILTPPTRGGAPVLPPNFGAFVSNLTPQQPAAQPNQAPTAPGQGTGVQQPYSGDFPVNSGFETASRPHHEGLDLGLPAGTPVLAATSGTITHAASDDPHGYGTWVEVTSENGLVTRYGHLSSLSVQPGDKVVAGQLVGNSGATGDATGPHLHFEVRVNGKPVDPTPYLAGAQQPIIAKSVDPKGKATYIPPDPKEVLQAQAENIVSLLQGGGPVANVPQGSTITQPGELTPQQTGGKETTPGGTSGDWATDILDAIGAPRTPENMRVMDIWMREEGGANHNNPLNTTQTMNAGETPWNTLSDGRTHVWSYPSYQVGLDATVRTLLQGNMAGIVAALRQGTDAMAVARAISASHWGTGSLVEQALNG